MKVYKRFWTTRKRLNLISRCTTTRVDLACCSFWIVLGIHHWWELLLSAILRLLWAWLEVTFIPAIFHFTRLTLAGEWVSSSEPSMDWLWRLVLFIESSAICRLLSESLNRIWILRCPFLWRISSNRPNWFWWIPIRLLIFRSHFHRMSSMLLVCRFATRSHCRRWVSGEWVVSRKSKHFWAFRLSKNSWRAAGKALFCSPWERTSAVINCLGRCRRGFWRFLKSFRTTTSCGSSKLTRCRWSFRKMSWSNRGYPKRTSWLIQKLECSSRMAGCWARTRQRGMAYRCLGYRLCTTKSGYDTNLPIEVTLIWTAFPFRTFKNQ